MALAAATVWEIRTAGSDTNGGGFVTGAAGTDYSQQDAKNTAGADISTTDAVAAGTTTITSLTGNFGTTIVGNIVYFAGGTGSITGVWRQVTARASTTSITIDASIAASTGMTMNIGGALLSPAIATSVAVSANTIYIKTGAYSITTASTGVANGCVSSASGITLEGYQATRGDLGTAPVMTASGISTASLVSLTGNDTVARNLTVDGASLTAIRGFNLTKGYNYKLTAKNCTNNGFAAGGGAAWLEFSVATGCSTQPAVANFISCIACEIYSNTATGINSNASQFFTYSYNNSGASSDGFTGQAPGSGAVMIGCVAYGNGRDGFRGSSGGGQPDTVCINCIAEANTGIGFNRGSNTYYPLHGCAAYNNSGGNTSIGAIPPNQNINFVTGLSSFFVNAASSNFALNNTASAGAAARATGSPGLFPRGLTQSYPDIGAAQHADPVKLLTLAGMTGGME